MIAAFAGLTIAVAVKAAWWWPFAIMLAVTGFGYLFGLSTYGVAEEGAADDANATSRGPRSTSDLLAIFGGTEACIFENDPRVINGQFTLKSRDTAQI
jgi:hypothetical protein